MAQPDLPADIDWPAETREWWAAWGEDPRTENCTLMEWLYLRDGALLHAHLWRTGDIDCLAALRDHVDAFEERLVRSRPSVY